MPLSLADWQGFYVITGSSGAALTGLMFVVVALAADRGVSRQADGLGVFSTPTVTHFSIVLLIASIMAMPLHRVLSAAICLGATGAVGLAAIGVTGLRMRKLKSYSAVPEDWLWHVFLPCGAYALLLAAACVLGVAQQLALIFVAVTVLALLFIGIHNAWDVAVFLAVQPPPIGAPK